MYHYIDIAYQNRDGDQYGKYDEKLSASAEDCLGHSISYFRGLLDSPAIWQEGDLGAFGDDPSAADQGCAQALENFLTEQVFTEARIFEMMRTLTYKFVVLNPKEI